MVFFYYFHPSKILPYKLLDKFIMVSGDVSDIGVMPALPKKFLNEQVMGVIPIPFALQLPAIYEIAHNVKMTALSFL
jgi:hypothetical protein